MSEKEPSSNPEPEPHIPNTAMEPDWKDYDLQIAIDQLAAGSTEALRVLLARQEGLDPNTASLKVTPWSKTEGSTLSFIGAMDDVDVPGGDRHLATPSANQPPRVVLRDTEIPFKYSPLDPELPQFRLLRLAPPEEDGVIHQLQLQTFSVGDAPPYLCLSYVWGDPDRFLEVNCNGETIFVTQNLFHALQTCFNRYPGSWLWADGICINQEDLAERSTQVRLMGNIYENALMIVAHPGHYGYHRLEKEPLIEEARLEDRMAGLGIQDMLSFGMDVAIGPEGSKEAEESYGADGFQPMSENDAYSPQNIQGAISIMTLLARIWSDSTRNQKIQSDKDWARFGLPDPETDGGREVWNNLVSFWAQDWYFRTWVLQEVILAAKVVILYGETAVSLEAITNFWSMAREHGLPRVLRIGTYADIFNRIIHMSPVSFFKLLRDRRGTKNRGEDNSEDQDADQGPSTPSLFELLCLSRNNLATDPRDKVYGLLGLTDDAVSQSIVPDYSQTNTAAKVFTDVTLQILNSPNATDLFHHAGVDQSISDLPSWVPDWTIQSRSTLPVHMYQCMGNTLPSLSVMETNGKPKLRVRGAVISQLNHAGPAWKFYSHDMTQHSFGSFKGVTELEMPDFNDEDARNFILTFAYSSEESIGNRYGDESYTDALARTMAVDCSWQNGRIGKRSRPKNTESEDPPPTSQENQSSLSTSADFFDGVDAFKRFYARGPDSSEDLAAPGIRVHQTAIFIWLLDFDEDTEADLQKRMVSFTVPFQEAQRGRRFATLGTRRVVTPDLAKADNETRGTEKIQLGTETLEDHFIGSVPWNAEIEDYVVLFEGFRTPFILRKVGNGRGNKGAEEFQIIGDCYVHGVMDGELLRQADAIDEKLEPDHVSVDGDGKKYAVRAPQGYVPFQEFILV